MDRRFEFHWIGETGSTNTDLKEMARHGAAEGTVLVAERQTGGKGRMGRSFFSPKSGLYMSFIIRPQNAFSAGLYTTMAAVATAEAISEVCGKEVGIKWVNDLFYRDRKICGILVEGETGAGGIDFAIVGIGINLSDPEGGWGEIAEIAGSLYGAVEPPAGVRKALAKTIVERYFAHYDALPDRGFLKEYASRMFLIGKEVRIIPFGETGEGISQKKALVTGIGNDAELLVKNDDGTEEAIFTGEVSVKMLKQTT